MFTKSKDPQLTPSSAAKSFGEISFMPSMATSLSKGPSFVTKYSQPVARPCASNTASSVSGLSGYGVTRSVNQSLTSSIIAFPATICSQENLNFKANFSAISSQSACEIITSPISAAAYMSRRWNPSLTIKGSQIFVSKNAFLLISFKRESDDFFLRHVLSDVIYSIEMRTECMQSGHAPLPDDCIEILFRNMCDVFADDLQLFLAWQFSDFFNNSHCAHPAKLPSGTRTSSTHTR